MTGLGAHLGIPARRLAGLGIVATLFVALPVGAHAQDGFGVRGGVSADPDQFYVGAHYVTSPIASRVRFQPNLEVGVGDDVTTVAANFEFAYWARLNPQWQLYAGGGPALNVYDFEGRDGDTEPGMNLMVGFRHRQGLFFEFKVGLIDSPEVKFGVGYTFR